MTTPIPFPTTAGHHPVVVGEGAFHDAAVVFLPSTLYKPNARSMGDLKPLQAVGQVARGLQALAFLVHHPDVGEASFAERLADPKARLPSPMPTHYFTANDGQRAARTRQFLEVVYAPDGATVVGWRLFLFNVDPSTNFARGVRNLLALNGRAHAAAASSSRFRPPPPPRRSEQYKRLLSLGDWAYGVCDAYLASQTMANAKLDVYDPEKPLDDNRSENPCNPYTVFALERAVAIPSASARQRTLFEYRSEAGADGVVRYHFPEPDRVWEIDSELFHPNTLDAWEFPTNRTLERSPLAELSLFADRGTYRDQILGALAATRGFVASEFQYKTNDDLALLAVCGQKLLAQRRDGATTFAEELRTVHAFKRGFLEQFRKFWCEDSNLSMPVKKMLAWENQGRVDAEEAGRPFTMATPQLPVDRGLSPFANLMIRRMVQYEQLLQTSTVHRELLITLVARLDAYRRSFDLHTHPLLAGAGSSSKSYILNCIEKLSIPGTVQTVTHITAKADAVDENQNDVITLFHEMPKSLIGVEEKGETGDPMFKERLTSNKFKTKLFCVDEDTGKRSNRVAESECIGMLGGCTNDPPGKIPEALRSRFMVMMCPQVVRRGREVMDLFGTTLSPAMKAKRDVMVLEHQREQYLVCLVEKLIWCGVLADVDMEVAHTIFRSVLGNLEQVGIHVSDPRKYTRITNTARTLAIMAAVDLVFNSPGADDQPFDVRALLAVEPHLLCSEEIAYFTLTLLQAEYINPIERHVGEILAKECHYSREERNDANYRPAPEASETGFTDFNFVQKKAAFTFLLAGEVCKKMRKYKSSTHNVDAVLRDLLQRTVYAPLRDAAAPGGGGAEPVPILEYDRNTEGGMFYVSTAWLDRVLATDYDALMRTAIRETFHRHSRPRTILLGETFRDEGGLPHLWRTLEVVPNPDHQLVVENAAYKSDFEHRVLFGDAAPSAWQTAQNHPRHVLDDDCEELEWCRHMDAIGCPDDQGHDALPANAEACLRERHPDLPSNAYPDEWAARHRADTARANVGSVAGMKRRRDGTRREVRRRVKRPDPPPADNTLGERIFS